MLSGRCLSRFPDSCSRFRLFKLWILFGTSCSWLPASERSCDHRETIVQSPLPLRLPWAFGLIDCLFYWALRLQNIHLA